MPDIWSNKAALDDLEFDRKDRRKVRTILTFDCFNAHPEGNQVRCVKGHRLRQGNETLSLASVLRGITPPACKGCPDFDGG